MTDATTPSPPPPEAAPTTPPIAVRRQFDLPSDETLELIRRRCADASIACDSVPWSEGVNCLQLSIPNGRETRPVYVVTSRDADRLLDVPFELYVFLADYRAICSYEDGTIEAAVRPIGIAAGTTLALRRLFGEEYGRLAGGELPTFELHNPDPSSPLRIRIGPASRALQVLAERTPRLSTPTIMISGLQVKRHDHALAVLEKVCNSVFFQLAIAFNVSLTLSRDRSRRALGKRRLVEADRIAIREATVPAFEYASEPLTLYWYGRSAAGMPLLQFLAYYQSLEFFFPIYSQKEAQRRLGAILRDPTFSAHRDTDVGRLLTAIRSNPGAGFGDERSQLRATILECTAADELRAFIQQEPERAEFLAKDKAISDRRLPLANVAADLRADVADRIYDIRCKIVHTKVSGVDAVEPLMPFSKEAELLYHDIAVVHFLARGAIITSGSALHL